MSAVDPTFAANGGCVLPPPCKGDGARISAQSHNIALEKGHAYTLGALRTRVDKAGANRRWRAQALGCWPKEDLREARHSGAASWLLGQAGSWTRVSPTPLPLRGPGMSDVAFGKEKSRYHWPPDYEAELAVESERVVHGS